MADIAAEPVIVSRPRAGQRAPLRAVRWQALESELAAWDRLAEASAEPNPFVEPWYLLPSLRAFDPQGEIAILRFEHAGALAGLMPIVRRASYYGMPLPVVGNWLHANSFCGTPLVAKGREVPFWQAFLRWADRHAGKALFFHLRGIPLDGPLHAALMGVLGCEDRPWQCVHREERALLCSNSDPQAYWEGSLSGKKRKELRRQARRLAELGALSFERLADASAIDAWTSDFLALEASGWKGRHGSALTCDPATQALFRESLYGAALRGRLERLALRLDGRPIAMLATLLAPPGAFSFKTAYDEDFSGYSPGVLLQRENLAMLAREDIAWTDSCASEGHPMIDHIWRERRTLARFNIGIGGGLRRAAFRQVARFESSFAVEGDPR